MKRTLLAVLAVLILGSGGARAQMGGGTPDVEAARRAGMSDGESAGRQEGESRGYREGDDKGYREGKDREYRSLSESLARRAYDDGLREGRYAGSAEGQRRGETDGRTAGQLEGRAQGEKEGDARARREADLNASAPGAQAGRTAAEASDAQARGRTEGVAEGDAQARARALEVDYARGRAEYFRQRSAEPVKGTAPLKPGPSALEPLDDGFVQAQWGGGGSSRYPTPEENWAYRRGYDEGFDRARRATYDRAYRDAYDRACSRGRDDGRREAERRDYSFDRRRGSEVGYREQYDSTYASYRATAYNLALAEESARVAAATYSQRYQGYYDAAFARFKDEAYQARYEALRTAARTAAREETLARNYPDYAKAEFQRGRVDEKADLADRPVRIVTVGITTPGGGPPTATGQPLGLNLSMRNYGETKYASGALAVELVPLTPGSAFLPSPRLAVGRDFPSQVVLAGRGLSELQIRREFAGQDVDFEVRVLLNGRVVDRRVVKLSLPAEPPAP